MSQSIPQAAADALLSYVETHAPEALAELFPAGAAGAAGPVVAVVMDLVRKGLAAAQMPGVVVDAGVVSWRRVGQAGQ